MVVLTLTDARLLVVPVAAILLAMMIALAVLGQRPLAIGTVPIMDQLPLLTLVQQQLLLPQPLLLLPRTPVVAVCGPATVLGIGRSLLAAVLAVVIVAIPPLSVPKHVRPTERIALPIQYAQQPVPRQRLAALLLLQPRLPEDRLLHRQRLLLILLLDRRLGVPVGLIAS